MTTYKNRYQAKKHISGYDKIIKVCGGYVIMSPQQYRIWRRQK